MEQAVLWNDGDRTN